MNTTIIEDGLMSYFENFGHTCGLKIDADYRSYLNNLKPLDRFLIKWTSIDPKSEPTMQYFKSHAAIVNGTKFHIENHPITIHPFSRFKFIWELVMAVNFLTGLIYGPLQYLDYIDDDETTDIGNITLIKIVKFICVMDMILRFFCGYVDEKKFTVSREKINFLSFCRHKKSSEEKIMSLWRVVE